ncbi:MAG: gamma-glutamyltransferase family protein [Christensenellales bacterium]
MLPFDPLYVPYAATRYPLYARGGMVATGSPQAAAAGLQILRQGGNAVDAALAAATALTVVEPTANGIGSDAFALVWIEKDKRLYGLNASGWAPGDITIDKVLASGARDGLMPTYGWAPTMVPGAPKGWAALSRRFGRLPLKDVMAPAIGYAQDGYPAGPNLARMWQMAARKYEGLRGDPAMAEWFRTFLHQGEPPRAGQMVRLKAHARTLQTIADSMAEDFYRGELARMIVADSREFGGYFSLEDFAQYEVSWVEPLQVDYRGYQVCEIPPNGQGIVALMALNILKHFDFPQRECASSFHTQWEAIKLAFADAKHYVTDPAKMTVTAEELLGEGYGKARAALIDDRAALPGPGTPPSSGTVYLCTADGEGNMVSYIQSNYMGFGSGVVVRGTGIALQNRGHDFSLDPAAANALAPRKKTYHTIIPGFLMKDGEALGPFGVMGGYMQPQGHVQVIMNLIDYGMNPQQALDAPRWQWMKDRQFLVEASFNHEIAKQLAARGHRVEVALDSVLFGRGQVILRQPNGVLIGGTESRTDSSIACF